MNKTETTQKRNLKNNGTVNFESEIAVFILKTHYPSGLTRANICSSIRLVMSLQCQAGHETHYASKRIPFTLTFHPHGHAVKSIILKNYKLLQNDPDTGRIFTQPPLISFKEPRKAAKLQNKNLFFKSALLTVLTNALHSTNLFSCFSRYQAPTNSVAPYFCI